MKDMDVLEFARKISMLSTDTPLAAEFDKIYGQKENCWWLCQREHLTVWCLHYPTEGVNGYKHKPSNSSKEMYNHFGRPETLLWLIESLGENKKIIQDLIDRIKGMNAASACSEIRKTVSYERIFDLLVK